WFASYLTGAAAGEVSAHSATMLKCPAHSWAQVPSAGSGLPLPGLSQPKRDQSLMCLCRCAHTIDGLGNLSPRAVACAAASSPHESPVMAKYAEILFRHRIRFTALVLIPIVLCMSIVILLMSYRAAATLRIEDPSAFGASFEPVGWTTGQTPAQNLADSVNQVVKAPAFAQSLSRRLSSAGSVSSAAELRQTLASTGTSLK